MQKEYINFMNKRVLYLSQGDADTPVQTYYSVLVENIPAKVSNNILKQPEQYLY